MRAQRWRKKNRARWLALKRLSWKRNKDRYNRKRRTPKMRAIQAARMRVWNAKHPGYKRRYD